MWSFDDAQYPHLSRTTNKYLFTLVKKRLKIKQFRGTFPCDLMPRKLRNEQIIIVNTDPHHRPGSHYIVLYRKKKTYFYFDSLCLDMRVTFPMLHRELLARKFTPLHSVLAAPIQAVSSIFCGYFCVDYILSVVAPHPRVPKHSNLYNTDPNTLHLNDRICIDNIIEYITRTNK